MGSLLVKQKVFSIFTLLRTLLISDALC